MKLRSLAFAVSALLVSGSAFANTGVLSIAVTGATTPATTGVNLPIPNNVIVEVVGVVPVVSTVTGAPASMAANVNVGTSGGFNQCGAGTPSCSNDAWVAQWTIVSAPTGIQAVNAYQGTSLKLANLTGASATINFRCQVGQMTGSCIFTLRAFLTTDPLF
ncbi:MAG: hypothetical protein LC796_14470 [Acidobacteria bacterium]|nr:hypothetical protein [Acidobacteriota bacterium]MCA1610567.1 hypothetical protein [Acidobacteriota bacterium]